MIQEVFIDYSVLGYKSSIITHFWVIVNVQVLLYYFLKLFNENKLVKSTH